MSRRLRSFLEEEGDCYRVTAQGDDRYLVEHFPDRETRKPCCRVIVTVSDADRARAIPDADPHGHAAALSRVSVEVERRHQGIVDNNSPGC